MTKRKTSNEKNQSEIFSFNNEELLQYLKTEYPRYASRFEHLSRRDFLKLLAGPLAFAGLTACMPQPRESIIPYNDAPANLSPGEPLFFASAMELGGYARGVLVESRTGRPTKVEGNPAHPASLGGTDPYAQGSILSLYNPQRAQVVMNRGLPRDWNALQGELSEVVANIGDGAGLRILTGTVTSPTFANQIRTALNQYPQATWHQYDPVGRDQVRAASEMAFGEVVETQYNFLAADVILSLGSDFMFLEPGNLRYIREFSERRNLTGEDEVMNRLYVVESSVSITGASADHRWPLRASQIETFAREVANRLGVGVETTSTDLPIPGEWIDALVQDLQAAGGSSLVIAGPQQPPVVQALAHAINDALGNVGNTVFYTDPVEANPVNQLQSLQSLVEALQQDAVDVLVIFGENPVYTAPADFAFAEAMQRAGLSIYLSLYHDETAALADWHIPETHFLEAWSDTRAYDGTVSIIQPLIYPLYNGHTRHELMALLLGSTRMDAESAIRLHWQARFDEAGGAQGEEGETTFERFWHDALRDGLIAETASPIREVSLNTDFAGGPGGLQSTSGLEIVFEPDPTIWDGLFFNNAWLQELPKPLTKIVWDNAALVSPNTAEALELSNEDVVELRLQDRSVRAPVWILPGVADNTVVVSLGYGQAGPDPENVNAELEIGFNAYAIRTSENFWAGQGLEVSKTGGRYSLARGQVTLSQEGRHLVQAASLEHYQEEPNFARELPQHYLLPGGTLEPEDEEVVPEPPSLYPEYEYDWHAWGMAINLNTCIGCNACVIACQVENNIPVVGKEQVQVGRAMHWLRVDRYLSEDEENPDFFFQPVPCMHCEKAPCEPVCPVAATTHTSDGLNTMVYSRCIGTRYCSNNCPYKVRRFNFLDFTNEDIVPLQLWRNPEVSVRSRGVMEKCTYCIQRISAARTEAKANGVEIQDGDVVPACAQACPSQAIVFGDINDPESNVRRLKEMPRNYGMLAELGTRPRTTYLAVVRNPNPAIPNEGTNV